MKPNPIKPIKTPQDPKSYVLQRKLDILSRVYWMIANTQWNYNQIDALEALLEKFIKLSDGLGEQNLKKEMKLKSIMKGKLIQKRDK
jgi:hypothetical protein